MAATPSQIFRAKIQRAELIQVFCADTAKFVQQHRQRFSCNLLSMPLTIKGLKGTSLAEFHNHLYPRNPVGTLGMNQMADDVKGAPCFFSLVTPRTVVG